MESTHDTSIYFTETGNVVVDPEYQGLFPSKIVSRLTSWKRSTYEDFAVLPHAQALVDDEVVEQSDIFFTAVIERGSGIFMSNLYLIFFIFIEICVIVLFLYDVGFKRSSTGILNWDFFFIAAKMTAQIVMTHDYPKVAPVFVVSVLWQHERTAANDKHIKVRTCTRKSSLLQYCKLGRLL